MLKKNKTEFCHISIVNYLWMGLLGIYGLMISIDHLYGDRVETYPLLQKPNFSQIGSFRLPSVENNGSQFGYGGTAIAYNEENHSLFIVGHDWDQMIAEVAIPQLISSQNINALNTAEILQGFMDITAKIPNNVLEGTTKIGGLQVVNNELIGTLYEYYDAAGNATRSHFKLDSLNLTQSNVSGLFKVGNVNPGFVAGYMCPIPTEWQSQFGGTYITGQAALSIISRTSAGPAAFSFSPDQLTQDIKDVFPLVYYPISHPLANETSQNKSYNLASTIEGVVMVPGSRSILFFGAHGIGEYCYGTGEDCNDPVNPYKGTHAYPYQYQVWAYDALDFIKVKNSQKNPWEIKPYSIWKMNFGYDVGNKRIGGVAYDLNHQQLYISQLFADQNGEPLPLIHVFDVDTESLLPLFQVKLKHKVNLINQKFIIKVKNQSGQKLTNVTVQFQRRSLKLNKNGVKTSFKDIQSVIIDDSGKAEIFVNRKKKGRFRVYYSIDDSSYYSPVIRVKRK